MREGLHASLIGIMSILEYPLNYWLLLLDVRIELAPVKNTVSCDNKNGKKTEQKNPVSYYYFLKYYIIIWEYLAASNK